MKPEPVTTLVEIEELDDCWELTFRVPKEALHGGQPTTTDDVRSTEEIPPMED